MVKGQGHRSGLLQICFWMITPVRINELFQTSPNYHPSLMPRLILGANGERLKSQVRIVNKFTSGFVYTYIHVSLLNEQRLQFGFEKVYDHDHRSGLNQNEFHHDNSSLNQ